MEDVKTNIEAKIAAARRDVTPKPLPTARRNKAEEVLEKGSRDAEFAREEVTRLVSEKLRVEQSILSTQSAPSCLQSLSSSFHRVLSDAIITWRRREHCCSGEGWRAPQTWTVLSCEGRWTRAVSPRRWKLVPRCQRVLAVAKLDTRKRGVDYAVRSAAIVARLGISERCADNVRNLLASRVRAAVARVLAKAARAVETQTSAIAVDRSVIDDLIVLVATKVAVSVANVDI